MQVTNRQSCGNAVVPMDATGEIVNEEGFAHMLRYMSEGGTNVFVGGPHATEFVNVSPEERHRLWEHAVKVLQGVGPVNAIPFGPTSTTEMIKMFRDAKTLGFDGAQLYPGAQWATGSDGLFISEADRYYRDVLEAVDMPMYLCGYHGGEIIDSPTGMVPGDVLLQLIDEYPHIVALTLFGWDDASLLELLKAIDGRVPVRLASAPDWYEKMELGIRGFHTIQQSIAPTLCSSMIAAFGAGEHERAKELSAVIGAIDAIIHTRPYHYPRSIKPILNHLGFDMGIIRRPYQPPTLELQHEMQERIDALELGRFEDLPRSR